MAVSTEPRSSSHSPTLPPLLLDRPGDSGSVVVGIWLPTAVWQERSDKTPPRVRRLRRGGECADSHHSFYRCVREQGKVATSRSRCEVSENVLNAQILARRNGSCAVDASTVPVDPSAERVAATHEPYFGRLSPKEMRLGVSATTPLVRVENGQRVGVTQSVQLPPYAASGSDHVYGARIAPKVEEKAPGRCFSDQCSAFRQHAAHRVG